MKLNPLYRGETGSIHRTFSAGSKRTSVLHRPAEYPNSSDCPGNRPTANFAVTCTKFVPAHSPSIPHPSSQSRGRVLVASSAVARGYINIFIIDAWRTYVKKCEHEIHMEIRRQNFFFFPHMNCAMIYRAAIYFENA